MMWFNIAMYVVYGTFTIIILNERRMSLRERLLGATIFVMPIVGIMLNYFY